MKKNITTNFCGRLYQIDEDAFEMLNNYTESIRKYFSKQPEGNEVADDIEQRIAELLDEHVANGNMAISIECVDEIMKQVGNLNDITGNNTSEGSSSSDTSSEKTSNNQYKYKYNYNPKKFYRDITNRRLCGVFSGCGHYFNQNPTTLRWIFIALCLIWFLLSVGFSLSMLFTPFLLLSVPSCLIPVLCYFVVAIFTPQANSPEDMLRMKGKDINPQTIAEEVSKQDYTMPSRNNYTAWNVFSGCASILFATITVISLLIAIGCGIALYFNILENNHVREIYSNPSMYIPAIITAICLLTSLGTALYCFIHSISSSFKKVTPMKNGTRIALLIIWLFSTIGFAVMMALSISRYRYYSDEYWRLNADQRNSVYDNTDGHVHEDGIYYSDSDWEFLQEGRWTVVSSGNTQRYTYSGQSMTDNPNELYLDADNEDYPVIVTIQRTDTLEPGTYILAAAVRANNENRYIFAQIEGEEETRLAEIPNCDNYGGCIQEIAYQIANNYDEYSYSYPLGDYEYTFEHLKTLSATKINKLAKANDECGWGWNYVTIRDIVITQPTAITYGISTDPAITEITPTEGWFSATDFHFTKVEEPMVEKRKSKK